MARNNFFLVLVYITYVAGQQPPGPFGQLNCGNKADIVFLIDKTGSVGKDVSVIRDFTMHWANKLNLDDGTKFRAGIVSYAVNPLVTDQDKWATRVSELDEMNVTKFEENLKTITYKAKESLTNIEAGLRIAYEMLIDTSRGARDNVPKFLVFTNEGKQTWPIESWNPNNQAIQNLHNHKDITVFSIEIEKQHGEAYDVASDPKAENYIFISQYSQLNDTVKTHDKIEKAMCKQFHNPSNYMLEINDADKCKPDGELIYQMTAANLQNATSPNVTFKNVNNVPFTVSTQGKITKNGDFTKDKYEFDVTVTDLNNPDLDQKVTFRITVVNHNETCPPTLCKCNEDFFWKETYCPKSEWQTDTYDSKINELKEKKTKWNGCKATTRSYIADCENRPFELDNLLETFCQCGALVSEACKMIENLEEAKKNI